MGKICWIVLIVSSLSFVGCASGPRIDTSIGSQPPSAFGWNIGAGDLLDPTRASCRLGVYLDELTAHGYAPRIRIVFTPQTGPFQLQHWLPVIRAKGYRILAILSQGGRPQDGYDHDLATQQTWIRNGLPQVTDVLDAVQIANEPDGFSGRTPDDYAAWHRAMVSVVRETVPGVPIVSPDLRGVGAWNRWVLKTGLTYGPDYDIVSLHVTHQNREDELRRFIKDVRTLTGHRQPRVWITEGDWGQARVFSVNGLPIERTYVYVWNCNMGGYGPVCEPETRRPQGGSVPVCDKAL